MEQPPPGASGLTDRPLQPPTEDHGEGGLLEPLHPGAASKVTEQLPSLLESQAGGGGKALKQPPYCGWRPGRLPSPAPNWRPWRGRVMEPLLPGAASKETEQLLSILESQAGGKGFEAAPLKLSRPLKMSFKFERNIKRLSLFTKPHRNIP